MVSGVTGITGVSVLKRVASELLFNHVSATPLDRFMVGSTVSEFVDDIELVIPRYILGFELILYLTISHITC